MLARENGPAAMNKAKILVVDDDVKLARLVKTILERTGLYDVEEETRPNAAMAKARRFQPDMILLDVNMPGKDGGEVAQELRADPALCHKPVLFVTCLLSAEETGGRELRSGGKLFLAKPVDAQALLSAVDLILRERGACDSSSSAIPQLSPA